MASDRKFLDMTNNTTIVILPVNTLVLENKNSFSFNENMKFSERLKAARLHANLSQEELALRLNASQSLISKIELGHQEESTLVVKMAKACGVSTDWLDSGEGNMLEKLYITNTTPEAQLFKVMQNMDAATKYQLVKIGITLAEPAEKPNGTQK